MPPFLLSIADQIFRPAFETTVNFVSWAPRLAVARLVAKWRSLLTIIVGVVLGAGIGALVPLYTTAVAQVGLVQRLNDEAAHDANIRLRTSFRLADFSSRAAFLDAIENLDNLVNASAAEYLESDDFAGWLTQDDIVHYHRTTAMGLFDTEGDALQQENPERPNDYARTHLLWLDGWEDEVTVVAGVLPSQAELPDGVDFNVAISTEVSNEFGLEAGDVLVVDERLDRDGDFKSAPFESSQPFTVQVSAVFAPKDEDGAYWMAMRVTDNDPEKLDSPIRVVQISWPAEFWMFTSQQNVLDAIDFVPETRSTVGWRLLINPEELPYTQIDDARERLGNFQNDLNVRLDIDNTAVVDQFELAENMVELDLNYDYHTRLIDYQGTQIEDDEGILLDYDERQSVNFIPFLILLLEVGGLVLIFLVITAALVRRGERREISMLQSRGAFDGQVLALRSIEAFLICAFGALVAPFLAQRLLQLLGPTIAGTDEFPLPLTNDVFIWSSLLAGITFVALTATLLPVLRLPLISYGGSATRSETLSWWQKYYVDVQVAILAISGFVALIDRDTPLLSNRQIDPLLVVAPALLFLGLSSLALRVFPIIASQMAAINNRRRGVLGSLASWQLSREPIHYGRITFLLALAIGIGWFAMSFQATVQRSQRDQAGYQVGTDIRLYERDIDVSADRVRDAEAYVAMDGIEGANQSFRTRFTLASGVTATESGDVYRFGELLAVEDDLTLKSVVSGWRNDLGIIYTPRESIAPPDLAVVGELLPSNPDKIGMWARMQTVFTAGGVTNTNNLLTRLTQRVQLGVRLQDSAGTWIVAPFNAVRIEYLRNDSPNLPTLDLNTATDAPGFVTASHLSSGWVYFEADLSQLRYDVQGDVRLVSIYWEHRSVFNQEQGLRLSLADMTLIDAAGDATPLPLLRTGSWSFVQDAGADATGTISAGREALRDDIAYIDFGQQAQRTRVGINLNYPAPQPMPAVVSSTFAEVNSVEEVIQQFMNGDEAVTVDDLPTMPINGVGGRQLFIKPHRTVDYFPSLYNEERPFVIVDIRELMYALNQRPTGRFYPTEAWLNVDEDINSVAEVNALIDRVTADENVIKTGDVTYAQVFDDLETDPLALGLLGLMFLAFLIALVLSVVGLLTHASLTAQARRSEFGVLRALGLASSGVVRSLIMEQLFVVIIAGILGSVLGAVLSEFVVPTLALGATGEGVVPPFVTEIEWTAIANFWGIMLVVMFAVFAFAFFLVRQLSLSRTLRLGEE